MANNRTRRQTKIDNWEKNIDYVMFVDENRNSDITNALKTMSQRKPIENSDTFFTVTGCIFSKSNYIIAKNEIERLKCKYWENGDFLYKQTLQKVCFHSREIRKRIGAFHPSIINYDNFMNDLSSYPIHKYVRSNIKDKAFNIVEKKIDKFPNYNNKGLKIFP